MATKTDDRPDADTVKLPAEGGPKGATQLPADTKGRREGEEGDPRRALYERRATTVEPVDPTKEEGRPYPSQDMADAIKEGRGARTKEELEAREKSDKERAEQRRERDAARRQFGPRVMPAAAGYETR